MAKTKRTLNWIACSYYGDWWHTFCLDLSSNKKRKFVCPKCCWWTIVVSLILVYISLITLVLILLVLLYTKGSYFCINYYRRIVDTSLILIYISFDFYLTIFYLCFLYTKRFFMQKLYSWKYIATIFPVSSISLINFLKVGWIWRRMTSFHFL